MKIASPRQLTGSGRRGAFSLPELMITLAIFSLLILATVSSQICGLRLYRIADTKLNVTTESRRVLDQVRDEIWSSKLVFVGNGGDISSFTLVADHAPHVGNALKICATTDTNRFVFYYLDATDSSLKRMTSATNLVTVLARNITNQMVFSAEDFRGVTVTNYLNNRVIKMALQVQRPEYFGGLAECSHLQTRVTRRSID